LKKRLFYPKVVFSSTVFILARTKGVKVESYFKFAAPEQEYWRTECLLFSQSSPKRGKILRTKPATLGDVVNWAKTMEIWIEKRSLESLD
jgi:hypothetical protein